MGLFLLRFGLGFRWWFGLIRCLEEGFVSVFEVAPETGPAFTPFHFYELKINQY
jgi:hypothetical protein